MTNGYFLFSRYENNVMSRMLYPYRNICNRTNAEQSNQLFKDTEVKTVGLILLGYEFSVDLLDSGYF